jgi:hypothetical protein
MIRSSWAALILAVGFLALAGGRAAALDQANTRLALAGPESAADDPAPRIRRVRTRIEVRPARPPHRECASRLVQELRPSGPVIVPRMRCWWVR